MAVSSYSQDFGIEVLQVDYFDQSTVEGHIYFDDAVTNVDVLPSAEAIACFLLGKSGSMSVLEG